MINKLLYMYIHLGNKNILYVYDKQTFIYVYTLRKENYLICIR